MDLPKTLFFFISYIEMQGTAALQYFLINCENIGKYECGDFHHRTKNLSHNFVLD